MAIIILCGCSDYKEIENLATITSIGIDYINEEYEVTYEILDNKKESDKVIFESYTVSATGKSITEAFLNATQKVKLYPYFAHVELLLINKEISYNHMKEITDFLLRDNEIREYFTLAITDSSKDLLNYSSNTDKVISFSVKKLLEINNYSMNIAKKVPFADFISNIENLNIDNVLPFIETNRSGIVIKNNYAFEKYKIKVLLNNKNNYLYNLLTNNTDYYIKHDFDSNIMEISASLYKQDVSFKDNKIIYNISFEGSLINNETNLDLKEPDSYELINNTFKEILTNDIKEFIVFLQNNNTDILGIKRKYYVLYKKELSNWNNLDIDINVNFTISKKGITYDKA